LKLHQHNSLKFSPPQYTKHQKAEQKKPGNSAQTKTVPRLAAAALVLFVSAHDKRSLMERGDRSAGKRMRRGGAVMKQKYGFVLMSAVLQLRRCSNLMKMTL
jgi:hypothetical protein